MFLLLFLIPEIIVSQSLLDIEKAAEKQVDPKAKIEMFLPIIDSLLWGETDIYDKKLIDISTKSIDLCKGRNCGESVLAMQLNLAILKMKTEDYSDFNDFVLPTLTNYDFKDVLLKAKFLFYAGKVKEDKKLLKEAEVIYLKEAPQHINLFKTYTSLFYLHVDNTLRDTSKIYILLQEKFLQKRNEVILKIEWLSHKSLLASLEKNNSDAILFDYQISKLYEKHLPNDPSRWEHELLLCVHLINENRNEEALKILKPITVYYLQRKSRQLTKEYEDNLFWCYSYQAHALNKLKRYKEALQMTGFVEKYTMPLPPVDAPLSKQTSYIVYQYNIKTLRLYILLALEKFNEAELLTYELMEIVQSRYTNNNIKESCFTVIYLFFQTSKYLPKKRAFDLLPFLQEIVDKSSDNINKEKSYKLLTLLLITKGDQKAFSAYLITMGIGDSINQLKNEELSKELLVQYETKEKEQQLAVQETELSLRTTQRNIFIVGILIFGFLGWYFWRQNQRLRERNEIIQNQRSELQANYNSRNQFFANISHELRTPLTLIAGPVESIIQNNNLPSDALQKLKMVNRNVSYLKQMVNQVLDLSKKEVEELPLLVSVFSFSKMLKALVADFQPFADYQAIALIQPNNLENDLLLTTDGEKLFIALKNLLSNAFKYTNSGGQVTLTYVDIGQEIQISVQDNGRGIATADLPNIFNRFFQSTNKTIAEGGTGIGLAVCKEYIESIGGHISVNSELGKGSTFILQFPKQLQAPILEDVQLSFLEKEAVIINQELPFLAGNAPDELPLLLIAEDNLDMCRYLQDILQEEYQLSFASNGADALKQLEKISPDLILTDLMMPVMNGFELIENLKNTDKFRHIPIITLTARSEMKDKLHALRIGVDDYLMKPFHQEELRVRIANLLNYKEKREEFAMQEGLMMANAASDNEPTMEKTPGLTEEDDLWLKEIEALLQDKISDTNFGVSQIAIEMAISPSQLYRRIKELTGFTPKQYLNHTRYWQAKHLLESNKYASVKKVAYNVGFKDEKNFSRNFKKRFGKYPSEYI